MPDYYQQYCLCEDPPVNISMRDLDGNETTSYPVYVFNVNEVLIGYANNKSEYISVWNSDAANQAIGILSGGLGPFGFKITLNVGETAPDYVIGETATAGRPPEGIYESQYEDIYE